MVKMKFDDKNQNVLILYEDKGVNGKKPQRYPIAIPPGTNRTDVMRFGKGSEGYEYNSDAIIIISNGINRYVYHKGLLCAHTKLK